MEFSAPVTFDNPQGAITMNNPGDDYFLTKIEGADGANLRTPLDPRSQRDGGIVHRFFLDQMFPVMTGYFKATTVSQRNTLEDTLKGAVASCLRADGNWRMTPSGIAERFLTVRHYQPVVIQPEDGIVHSFTFGFVTSRVPLWLDYAEVDTTVNNSTTVNITNGGNTDSYPIIEVYPGGSAGTAFTLHNLTTGLDIVCAGSGTTNVTSVAAPNYAVVDIWALTIKQQLSGGGTDNMMDWLDEGSSDFWTLAPGVNQIRLTGDFDHAVVKSNNAWV